MEGDRVFAKAAAWYYITYSDPIKPRGLTGPILSFPWIISEYLMQIREANEETVGEASSAMEVIGRQLVTSTLEIVKDELSSNLIERFNYFSMLKNLLVGIIGEGTEIYLSGSTIGYAVGFGSDVNVHVQTLENVLMEKVYPALIETFPTIKRRPGLLEYHGPPFSFTIFSNPEWHSAALQMRQMISKSPDSLSIALILLKWARSQHIIRSSSIHSGKVTSLALILYCLNIIKGKALDECPVGSAHSVGSACPVGSADFEAAHLNELCQSLEKYDRIQTRNLGSLFLSVLQFSGFEDEVKIKASINANIYIGENLKFIREYSFQAYQLLSQTLDLSNLWKMSHSPEIEREIVIRKKLPRLLRRWGRSNSIFMEGCSVLLFEGSRTKDDAVNFDLYQLRRHLHHFNTQCYSPALREPHEYNPISTDEFLYQEYFAHSFRQYNLVRRVGSEEYGVIKAVVKFGDLYTTNLPRLFMEDATSATVGRVQDALKLGYKAINDTKTNKFYRQKSEGFGIGPAREEKADEGSLAINGPDADTENASLQLQLEKLMEEEERDGGLKALKGKAKKKTSLSAMNSSFRPSISEDANLQIRAFLSNNGFVCKDVLRSGHSVSLQLYNESMGGNFDAQVIYDEGGDYQCARYRPLRWISLDVRGKGEGGTHDYRCMLQSTKPIDLDGCIFEDSPTGKNLKELIKKGLIEVDSDSTAPGITYKVIPEFRSCEGLLVRFSRMECFQSSDHRAIGALINNHPTLRDIPMDLLEKLRILLIEVTEYTGHDPNTGRFADITEKREVELRWSLTWEELTTGTSEFILQLIPAMWKVAHIIKSLLD